MRSMYGKTVDEQWSKLGIRQGKVSTVKLLLGSWLNINSVQTTLTPNFIPQFIRRVYTGSFTISHLTEHYLYPVSTVPTINTTKEN